MGNIKWQLLVPAAAASIAAAIVGSWLMHRKLGGKAGETDHRHRALRDRRKNGMGGCILKMQAEQRPSANPGWDVSSFRTETK